MFRLSIDGKTLEWCSTKVEGQCIVPEGVVTIGNKAFKNCKKITEIILPDTVEYLYDFAFQDCVGIEKFTIPPRLKGFMPYSFSGCSNLKEFEVSNSNPYFASLDGMLCNKKLDTIFLCPSGKEGAIVIPSSIKFLGRDWGYSNLGAFGHCEKISSISLPPSIKKLNCFEFFRCSSLTEIEIPYGVETIEHGLCTDCTKLEKAKIPNTVTKVGKTAIYSHLFRACEKIKTIDIYDEHGTYAQVPFICSAKDIPPRVRFTSCQEIEIIKDFLYGRASSIASVPEVEDICKKYSVSLSHAGVLIKKPIHLLILQTNNAKYKKTLEKVLLSL